MKKVVSCFLFFCLISTSLYSDHFEIRCFHKQHFTYTVQVILNEENRGYIDDYYVLIPLEHPYVDTKNAILQCAREARDTANSYLEKADYLVNELGVVKDWRVRDRIKVLIVSAMGTSMIQEPRAKFLSVILALVTDLIVNEGIEKFDICFELYQSLSYATSCLEQYKYYSRLSLDAQQVNYIADVHPGYLYTNFAIDNLTCADMLTASLEYKLHGAIVSSYITELRQLLMDDMVSNRKLTNSYQLRMDYCLENLDEIVAESTEKDWLLVKRIRKEMEIALSYLKMAEKAWGLKKG